MTGKLGAYAILGDAGTTSYGTRYRVEHRVLGTLHDLEVLSDVAMRDAQTVETFLTAARARAEIGHRNIRAVRDCGRLRDGRWYAVADVLDGDRLDRFVATRGALPAPIALELVAQLANALEAIRAFGDTLTLTPDLAVIGPRDGNPLHLTVDWAARPIPRIDPSDTRALAVLAQQLVGDRAPAWESVLDATVDRSSGAPRTPRALVIALANADGGVELVRRCARELLDSSTEAPTLARRASKHRRARYVRGARIGEGGMGEVFRATAQGELGFARPVAIKYVHEALDGEAFAARFVDEARISSRLVHPNVVAVLDFDRDHEHRRFMVMELVDGTSLDRPMSTGALPHGIAAYVFGEMLRGLAHAHDHGVIHRDVSPSNVLISGDGVVKVSDFGIARLRDAMPASTKHVGKPPYRAPEHVSGADLDERTDLFCAGIVLWEMLVGRALFAGTERAILAQIATGAIPRPRSLRPEIPEELEAVVMRLLEREPARRYATAHAALAALEATHAIARNARTELVQLVQRKHRVPQHRSLAARSRTALARFHTSPKRPSQRGINQWWLIVAAIAIVAGVVAGVGATSW